MAKKLTRKEKQINELYVETTLDIGKNADNWISFLKRAGYNYKYRFDEQVLIYAQKPDAIACAETKIWNKRLKRWINKGSKGIALITERNGELGLRFVFDLSDTNSNVYGRKFRLWKAEERYTNDIIEALENRFGTMEDKTNLSFAIMSTICNYVVDNIQDYFEELKSVCQNSELQELSEKQLENIFLNLVTYSTIALTMSRCNLDVDRYLLKNNFDTIEKFNTFETMSILGTATRDFSREMLLEISKTIINIEKEEKKKNNTFEKLNKPIYNEEKTKGSVENGYDLHNEKQLSNTRLNNRKDNKSENEIGQIRSNEIGIFETKQEGNIYDANREQPINRSLDDNTKSSDRENRTDDRKDERKIWNNGRNESKRPDGMGRTNEQYSSNSGTNSNKRNNLQLNDEDYTFLVGDIVYIGLKEFTIIDINNIEMVMYENQFPLNQTTVKIKDVLQKIAENPMNDYLKDRKQQKETEKNVFNKWIDTFIEEKGIDLQKVIEIKTEKNTHYFEIGNIVENIKATTLEEQSTIKDTIAKIDFYNGDILDYFKFLAEILANNYEKEEKQPKEQQEKQEHLEHKEIKIAKNIIKENQNIEYFDLHPEIPPEKRNNFRIEDDNLGIGTVKEKFRNNVNAIKILKLCEKENRYATIQEQQILSKYVGWGGLKAVFDDKNESWSNEYEELRNLLSDEEYKNARASSVTAYYTPPVVIRNIYKALQNMGLKQANILEPSCRSR